MTAAGSLRFAELKAGDEGVVEVALEASTELGAHATGTATLSLPL